MLGVYEIPAQDASAKRTVHWVNTSKWHKLVLTVLCSSYATVQDEEGTAKSPQHAAIKEADNNCAPKQGLKSWALSMVQRKVIA